MPDWCRWETEAMLVPVIERTCSNGTAQQVEVKRTSAGFFNLRACLTRHNSLFVYKYYGHTLLTKAQRDAQNEQMYHCFLTRSAKQE